MTLFTFQMLPIDHRIKQKLLIIATKPLFHIYPSFHPELILDHLLYTLLLQTLILVVVVVVIQIFQFPFHLGTPFLFLLPDILPHGFMSFAASHHKGLSSAVTSSEVSLTSDLLWSKVDGSSSQALVYRLSCFTFCGLFTIIYFILVFIISFTRT